MQGGGQTLLKDAGLRGGHDERMTKELVGWKSTLLVRINASEKENKEQNGYGVFSRE